MVTEKNEETRENYTKKRNTATKIVREAHRISWDNFISQIEQDVHGSKILHIKF